MQYENNLRKKMCFTEREKKEAHLEKRGVVLYSGQYGICEVKLLNGSEYVSNTNLICSKCMFTSEHGV